MLPAPLHVTFGRGRGLRSEWVDDPRQLFRLFDRCGRERIRLRSVVAGELVLSPTSVLAVNAFLSLGNGLDYWRRLAGRYACHRYAWEEFQRRLGLEWLPLTARPRSYAE